MNATKAAIASRLTIHKSIASIRSLRKSLGAVTDGGGAAPSIGFVPTMGALHEGHLSLVQEARAKNDIVIASIFVNPTQFGVGEDLDKYPRQLEQDSMVLGEMGVDYLFAPFADDMYGANHVSYIDPRGFDDIAEGKSRPGHFAGVATIVTKLFNLIQPTRAYFGQKDAAQCCLIQRIVEDLNMDLEVCIMETIRESDGLAMSSRNAYLTTEERAVAPIVYKSLSAARDLYTDTKAGDVISAAALQHAVTEVLMSEPLVSQIQYVSVGSRTTMLPIETLENGAVISLACKVGSVRLIDNIVLK